MNELIDHLLAIADLADELRMRILERAALLHVAEIQIVHGELGPGLTLQLVRPEIAPFGVTLQDSCSGDAPS